MEKINLGTAGNARDGDKIRNGGAKVNANFKELVNVLLGFDVWQNAESQALALTALATEDKTSIVGALNELKDLLDVKKIKIVDFWVDPTNKTAADFEVNDKIDGFYNDIYYVAVVNTLPVYDGSGNLNEQNLDIYIKNEKQITL